MEKNYKLKPDQIQRLIPDIGFAFATDMITVEGKSVDYMARQQPDREGNSGWIFYGGGETQEYMDNPSNTSVLSVNTIANYDPEIISFLTYPPGTEVERNKEGRLQVISSGTNQPDVRFLYPAHRGFNKITQNWGFNISARMFKRFEKGSLVLWKHSFTIWINSYNTNGMAIKERVDNIIKTSSADKTDLLEITKDGIYKIKYHLKEVTNGKEQDAVYIFALTENHELHMSVYFDSVNDLPKIEEIWKTLEYNK